MKNKIQSYVIRNPFMVICIVSGAWVIGSTGSSWTAQATTAVLETKQTQGMDSDLTSVVLPQPAVVDLKYLNNAKVGGMVAAYFGHISKDRQGNLIPLPDTAEIDFSNNLQNLWEKKLSIKGVSGSTKKNADMIVERYKTSDPDIKGIKTFINEVDEQAKLAHSSIDFTNLCSDLNIGKVQCKVLKEVTGKIEGKQLVAYGMTEIMPSQNGEFNYVMLDTLLRNAGESYIQSIPALGDTLMSLGFYQFTSHAVYAADTKEGASFVDKYVSNQAAKIPGSVVALQGSDHHRAAFYFVTYNMARLMKRLNETESQQLASANCSVTEITQFIATAHHMPSLAIKKADSWIKGKCKKPIVSYMGEHLKLYANKTKSNLKAVDNRL